ncbi:MAG: glycoside hydrolase domain-containing protein [Planctomycetota bacterium]
MRWACWIAIAAACADAAAAELPNPSFEKGTDSPQGWQLQGKGEWSKVARTGERGVSVTGTGSDSSYWRTTDFRFRPDTLYRLRYWTRADRTTGGCVISGPSFCNRDFRAKAQWQRCGFVFATPAAVGEDDYLRLGQWHVAATVSFDDVSLQPTQAIHQRFGDIVLGEGERVSGTEYTFQAPLNGEGANHSRPLERFRCGFNSNRWCFHDGAEVVYRHAIPGHKQTAATVEITSQYYVSGQCTIHASTDGETWTRIGTLGAATTTQARVPAKLLPAEAVLIRLRGTGKEKDTRDSKPGNFQIHAYRYTATLDADLGHLYGATAYPTIEADTPSFDIAILALPTWRPDSQLVVRITNRSDRDADLELAPEITVDGTRRREVRVHKSHLRAGDRRTVQMALPLRHAGQNTIAVVLREGARELFRAVATRHVPTLHDAAYGHYLDGPEPVGLWWCESTHKVSRTRALPPVPEGKTTPVLLAAARNEYEPVQLVIRPQEELRNVRVEARPFSSREGRIGAEHVRIDRVAYVEITRPTDRAGARGWWPDPLPPFQQGSTLEADRNHPLWITVCVPPGQPAGRYRGSVLVKADGWAAEVPVQLRVWDFALPKMATLETGFGLRTGLIRRYHNLETTDELRQVLDLYFQNFAAHRIAPYDPAPLDPIRVEFTTGPWQGGAIDTTDPKEGRRCLRIVDDNERASIAAHNTKRISVDISKGYTLSWWVKTAKPDQPYLVTLQQYDADGKWIWGNNIDIRRTGSGKWQREEVTIPSEGLRPFSKNAESVQLALRPALYSEEGEQTGTAWFDAIRLARGDGPNLLADGGFDTKPEELKAIVDFEAWDKAAARTLGELGFNSFRYRLRGMGGGTFHSRRAGRIGPYVQGTPEYETLMRSQGRQVVEHFQARDWLDRAYMYWFDEPAPKDYAFVAEGMDLIARAAPGLTRFLTEQPEEGLIGHVDLWCPVVSRIGPETIAERKRAGERFWWYLCTGPKAPYIGLFIDRPAVDLRVWAWLSRKWGVEGQLVWTTNYWTSSAAFPPPKLQNPWDDPMSYVSGYGRPAGHIGYWGNGDGRFLYPPNRDVEHDKEKHLCGPVNSLRWEMLREGIEDYEYFALLDKLIARARAAGKAGDLLGDAVRLARVPDAVITDDKTYSKDPAPLHAHRRKVAEMVERLSRALR